MQSKTELPLVTYAMTPSRYFGGPGKGSYIVLASTVPGFPFRGVFTDADMASAADIARFYLIR
jgi:hypothetical protein